MTNLKFFENYVDSLAKTIPGFISATVVNTLDGQIIATTSCSSKIDNSLAACFQTQVLSEFEKGFEFIDDLIEKQVDHTIVFVENQIQVVYTMLNRSFLSHIIVNREKSNIALLEYSHNKYHNILSEQLIKSIGGEEVAKDHPFFNEVMFLN